MNRTLVSYFELELIVDLLIYKDVYGMYKYAHERKQVATDINVDWVQSRMKKLETEKMRELTLVFFNCASLR